MSTAKDLVQYARIMQHITQDDFSPRMLVMSQSCLKAAEYILATVQADDDEPITGEWLESVGFNVKGLAYKIKATDSDIEMFGPIRSGGGFSIHWESSDSSHGYLPQCKLTRGELRSLLRLLRLLRVQLVPRGTPKPE